MNTSFTQKVLQTIYMVVLVLVLSVLVNQSNAQCTYFKTVYTSAIANQCLGIKNDGSLWGWGSNQFGQLGIDSVGGAFSEPQHIGTATNWKVLATGTFHSLAITNNGELWAWGGDGEGELGDGAVVGVDSYVPVPKRILSPDSVWIAVSAAESHSVGITKDGKLWAWGYGTQVSSAGTIPNIPTQVATDTDWVAVSTGQYHTIAIKKDSTLWGWGINSQGEAGDSTTSSTDYAPPVEIDSNHAWVFISAGYDHSLALKKDGTLWAWGQNFNGELGDGTTVDGTHGPKQIGTKKWLSVAAGYDHSLGITKDGLRWAWGSNQIGQAGNDTSFNTNILVPTLTDSSKGWTNVYAGARFSLNKSSDESVWSSGDNDYEELGTGNHTRLLTLLKVGTPDVYPAIATTGSSDVEYQRAFSYYSADCSSLITKVFKSGADPIYANTTAKVWIDDTVKNDGTGKPFVQRHYDIHPLNNDTTATGTVYLYFTQDEFTAYNASANVMNGTYPMLPVDANDAQGYRGNLRMERIIAASSDGSGDFNTYRGKSVLIIPTSVVYADGRWQATFDVTGFGGFFATTGATLLPVTWINFSGNINNNNQAVLTWKVNELNTAGYSVEKSNDGISFNSIATIAGKNNGVNSYQYTDNLKVAGNLFYRVKQADKDGKSNYSKIISLNAVNNNIALNLFPNPASDHVFINGLVNAQTYHISITNMQGKMMLNKNISGAQNEILTGSLSSGIYIIKITADNYNTVLKFIKQ